MSSNIQFSELTAAVKSIKRTKNIFALLILVAMLSQITGFVLVQYFGVINEATPVLEHLGKNVNEATNNADMWYKVLNWALPMGKFIGLSCGILLVITMMFSAALSLLSPNGGIKGMYSAFFWSLILLTALTPWQQILQGSLISGAFFNLGDLMHWAYKYDAEMIGKSVSFTSQLPYLARFLAYPGLTFLIWLVVMVKFAGGCGKLLSEKSTPVEPQIR